MSDGRLSFPFSEKVRDSDESSVDSSLYRTVFKQGELTTSNQSESRKNDEDIIAVHIQRISHSRETANDPISPHSPEIQFHQEFQSELPPERIPPRELLSPSLSTRSRSTTQQADLEEKQRQREILSRSLSQSVARAHVTRNINAEFVSHHRVERERDSSRQAIISGESVKTRESIELQKDTKRELLKEREHALEKERESLTQREEQLKNALKQLEQRERERRKEEEERELRHQEQRLEREKEKARRRRDRVLLMEKELRTLSSLAAVTSSNAKKNNDRDREQRRSIEKNALSLERTHSRRDSKREEETPDETGGAEIDHTTAQLIENQVLGHRLIEELRALRVELLQEKQEKRMFLVQCDALQESLAREEQKARSSEERLRVERERAVEWERKHEVLTQQIRSLSQINDRLKGDLRKAQGSMFKESASHTTTQLDKEKAIRDQLYWQQYAQGLERSLKELVTQNTQQEKVLEQERDANRQSTAVIDTFRTRNAIIIKELEALLDIDSLSLSPSLSATRMALDTKREKEHQDREQEEPEKKRLQSIFATYDQWEFLLQVTKHKLSQLERKLKKSKSHTHKLLKVVRLYEEMLPADQHTQWCCDDC